MRDSEYMTLGLSFPHFVTMLVDAALSLPKMSFGERASICRTLADKLLPRKEHFVSKVFRPYQSRKSDAQAEAKCC